MSAFITQAAFTARTARGNQRFLFISGGNCERKAARLRPDEQLRSSLAQSTDDLSDQLTNAVNPLFHATQLEPEAQRNHV